VGVSVGVKTSIRNSYARQHSKPRRFNHLLFTQLLDVAFIVKGLTSPYLVSSPFAVETGTFLAGGDTSGTYIVKTHPHLGN
jgi:hypothetical protein